MQVKCIKNLGYSGNKYITVGKVYDVISRRTTSDGLYDLYMIVDNTGNECEYNVNKFEVVE